MIKKDIPTLIYNDPFNQDPTPGWYNKQIVYYLNLGRVFLEPSMNIVADIYQFVFGFDDVDNPIRVQQQSNVIDVVPGDPGYTPLWRIVFVVVPPYFVPQSIRSVQEIRIAQFPIVATDIIINCPVL
ncbi:hypothetical protein [Desulfoscipio gibsoniae]|uniref:Uncharacterized protein n=1 Tax=Desulfoscipio gibsoniae DSM 7213 TaxID=767817 RepID=R4KRV6_9FIRM|nr:hypothetical protein [Desulfoscipio gibsoniae]AGL02336.1 hypothetical protein Desgi_2947 [Desulfoscipio gibsoniae DSM 7213]